MIAPQITTSSPLEELARRCQIAQMSTNAVSVEINSPISGRYVRKARDRLYSTLLSE